MREMTGGASVGSDGPLATPEPAAAPPKGMFLAKASPDELEAEAAAADALAGELRTRAAAHAASQQGLSRA